MTKTLTQIVLGSLTFIRYTEYEDGTHVKYEVREMATDRLLATREFLSDAHTLAKTFNKHVGHPIYRHDGVYRCAADGATWGA